MTVSYDEYIKLRKAFFKKHGLDFKVYTSALDEYDRYHKEYVFKDNAQWCEVMGPYYETVTVNVKGVNIDVDVKLFSVEFYNTDDSSSKYYYEKY